MRKVCIIVGAEFFHKKGKIMLIVRALYGLKPSGAAFQYFLPENLDTIGYIPSSDGPYVWIRPAIKGGGFKYWKLVLCYMNDILCMIHLTDKTMDGIKIYFKLKDEVLAYLECKTQKVKNAGEWIRISNANQLWIIYRKCFRRRYFYFLANDSLHYAQATNMRIMTLQNSNMMRCSGT